MEWLDGAGLAAGRWGIGCDAGCRAFDINGVVTDNIFVAGDIARAPHVLYEYEFMAIEHVDAAVLLRLDLLESPRDRGCRIGGGERRAKNGESVAAKLFRVHRKTGSPRIAVTTASGSSDATGMQTSASE